LVDSEGWYSVTPEAIANKIACNIPPGSIVIDAFAGIGGNSIAFARQKSAIVYAVEIDAQRIKLAKNNAKVYGVSEKIKFIRADFFSLIPKFAKKFSKILKKGVEQPQIWIFLSPPWGGPNYQQKDIYRLSDMNMSDFDGFDLFKQVQNISKNVIYYLPKNVSVADLFKLAQAENHSYDQFTVEQHWLNDRFKVLAAYYTDQGNFEIKT
jgi:trimethylguanosine synthase